MEDGKASRSRRRIRQGIRAWVVHEKKNIRRLVYGHSDERGPEFPKNHGRSGTWDKCEKIK